MNLVVDVGNTRIKLGIFDRNGLVNDQICNRENFLKSIKAIFNLYPKIKRALLASVGGEVKNEIQILSLFCKVHVLDVQTKLPFKNSYASPQSLGVDRIALAAAAYCGYRRKNVLVIDAGTCITYDMVNDYGEYLGGAISPGLALRYKAMHDYTASLPLLDPKNDLIDFIGNTTENCMHSGVLNGVLQEVDGVINQYNARFKDLTVILTGGDSHFFAKRLKNIIFANSKFLLEGLNHLLEYNKQ